MGFSKKAYNFGIQQEQKLKPILEQYFKTTLEIPKNKFSRYDYYDENIEVELKSRRVKSDAYNTYHLCKGKIDYAKTTNKQFFIVLNFLDKIMVCDYSKHKIILDGLVGKTISLHRGDKCLNVEIPKELFTAVPQPKN